MLPVGIYCLQNDKPVASEVCVHPSVPVGVVHLVGQIQLTLLRERAKVFVVLQKVQQLRGIGQPEGENPGDGPVPLRSQSQQQIGFSKLANVQL